MPLQVVSLGAGAVSFTHIIKASEPVVSAALSAVLLGAVYSPITYLTLLPIVGGVALASLKELSFTWIGFIAAMGSNVSSALRGILAKKTMGGGVGENMTEANLYAVLTILAFIAMVRLRIQTDKGSHTQRTHRAVCPHTAMPHTDTLSPVCVCFALISRSLSPSPSSLPPR